MLDDDFNQMDENKRNLFRIRFIGRKEWHYNDKERPPQDILEAEINEDQEFRSTYVLPLIALGAVMQFFGSFSENTFLKIFCMVLGTAFFIAGCFSFAHRTARISKLKAELRALETKTHP
ncbi:hypothetical protein [Cerasicoccus arenae]|uniref:Uncharacterized protein n=1 Tax=Cerasicoccus arenae TaxID=424488 RepID=A0A8J3D887_9BACT|nr:hypothetical protein [Cerasicoccus arenae]MBK1859004.1 hypothetical protein [Cerasicoccus arenae]GHB94638.1 hypothetical protein GCM10007047_07690 [Cerasicoccus arenae]